MYAFILGNDLNKIEYGWICFGLGIVIGIPFTLALIDDKKEII
jgi:hypothetical protein